MKSVYVRNYLVFISLVILFAAWLVFTVVKQSKTIENSKGWITHTYDVISLELGLIARINGILAAQRAYLLTDDNFFKEKYDEHKERIDEITREITLKVNDNASQVDRNNEIKQVLRQFIAILDLKMAEDQDYTREEILGDVESIENFRNRLSELNRAFLAEERELLERRTANVSNINKTFLLLFLIGGASFALILLFFNSYILKSQLARLEAMNQLERTKERLDLAFEGMNDGIFDWDESTDMLKVNGHAIMVGAGNPAIGDGDRVIIMKEGVAPSTQPADQAYMYAANDSGTAEMYVMDAGGTATKISPHNAEGEWEFYSVNKKTNKKVRINMEKMIRKLEEFTGESFIEDE